MNHHTRILLAAVLAVFCHTAAAQVPQIINYQGRINVGASPFTGTGLFRFALVNGDGSTSFWSNDGTSNAGSQPTAAVSLPVANGLYVVPLGDTSIPNMQAVPASVFTNNDVRLRVWFNDGTNGSQLLSPHQRITSVGYAMVAGTVPDGAITSAKIAAGAVGTSQIANGAVGSAQLASGAVGTSQIANGAITGAQVAGGAITPDKLAKPVRTGEVNGSAMSFDYFSAWFNVTFSPTMSNTPVVSLTLDADPTNPVSSSSVLSLSNRTPAGFGGRISNTGSNPIAAPAIATIDNGGGNSTDNVGAYVGLRTVNGNPAISYYDNTNGDLKYVRANDASGTSWGTPVTVDTSGFTGSSASLAVVNGNPAISYYDATNGDLKYARANDTSGTSWGTPVTIDSTGTTGQFTSLAVVNGNPAISYYDGTNNDLRYIRANDASGTLWGTPVTIDSTGTTGQYTSLAVVNSNPAISYYDATNGDLKYVRANDTSGTSWATPLTIESSGTTGQYTSLAMVNGNPAISYYDSTNTDLKFIRATNANGSAWGSAVIADAAGGSHSSLTIANGNPAISYYSGGSYRYCRATDSAGSAWGTALSFRTSGSTGSATSIAIVDGNPAVAHYDSTRGSLIFERANDADGTVWSNEVVPDGYGKVGRFSSLAWVGGQPAVCYHDTSNGSLKYLRATDAAGGSWSSLVVVDSGASGFVGQYCSMCVVDGNPAIAYLDTTNADLKYVRANDAAGSTWGTPLVIDAGVSSSNLHVSLAIVDGLPAVSYLSGGALRFARASDATGSSWAASIGITSAYSTFGTSLAVIDGFPAIAFAWPGSARISFVRATNAQGSSWGTPVSVDSSTSLDGFGNQSISMQIVNGSPAILYGDGNNYPSNTNPSYLRYVRAVNSAGTAWSSPVIVTTVRSLNPTLLTTGDVPVAVFSGFVSGTSSTNYGVRIVRATDATGNGWGPPAMIDSNGNYATAIYAGGRVLTSYQDPSTANLMFARPSSALAPFSIQWLAQEP